MTWKQHDIGHDELTMSHTAEWSSVVHDQQLCVDVPVCADS